MSEEEVERKMNEYEEKLLNPIYEYFEGKISYPLIENIVKDTFFKCVRCKYNREHGYKCDAICEDMIPTEESFIDSMISRKEAMKEAYD